MQNSPRWVEALNISSEKLTEWTEQVPEGTPLLVWCLEQGLIPLEHYLDWACNHYGLPILNSGFFAEVFDQHGFVTERSTGLWSRWCFPICVWEGTTYVACVEPPKNIPEDGTYSFVLADPRGLSDVWGNTGNVVVASLNRMEAPVGMDLKATTTFQLSLDSATLMLDSMPPPAPLPPVPSSTVSVTMPEAQSSVSVTTPTELSPASVTKITIAESTLSAVNVLASTDFSPFWKNLKPEYQSAVLMQSGKAGLRPLHWSPELKPVESKATINLATPSLFRIVAKTGQAYHGYVVDSPAHRDLFTALGTVGLPGCVTAIPVVVEGQLWGVLVAMGNANAQTVEALQKCQSIADKIVGLFAKPRAKAA